MPSAEIIAIGTELVLGQTQDTNISKIAETLNSIGFDIFRASIVGDNKARIADEIIKSASRSDIIITTGGLGPTVDDPTREAVADAFKVSLEYHPELWQEIVERFQSFGRQPTENNKKQAYIPDGANPIHNPIGTAPAFYIQDESTVFISLPGVPHEMQYLLENDVVPLLKKIFRLKQSIFSRIVHTASIGESQLDEIIGEMEMYVNPTVGLAAYPGRVDIRITAKAESEKIAQEMIEPIENEIKQRLGIKVYGTDSTSLPEAVHQILSEESISLHLFYEKSCIELAEELFQTGLFEEIIEIRENKKHNSLQDSKYNNGDQNDFFVILGCRNNDKNKLDLQLSDNRKINISTQIHSNPEEIQLTRAVNLILQFIREAILEKEGEK